MADIGTVSPEDRADKRKRLAREAYERFKAKHPERLRELRRQSAARAYARDPRCQIERNRRWAAANPEEARATARRYRETHPEAELVRAARARVAPSGQYGRRHLECTITAADVVIPEFCPALGIKLVRGTGRGGHRPESPVLDRIDGRKGYIPGNVAVISRAANAIKSDFTAAQLREMGGEKRIKIADWMDRVLAP